MGSWGSVFPLSASNSGVGGAANAMATSGRMLFKMHRQLLLWAGMGSQGLCSKYPMPIMRKSMYGMYPVYPLMTYPYRVPIGRSGMVFGAGANAVGISNHVWTIMLYRKRECCVL